MSGHASVVMAYGDSPFLGDCLASLRAQTAPTRIVVATSTPSAFIEAAAGAAGAAMIVNPEAAGIAADWNFALGATDAPKVTLAHQDDVYFPHFVERSLALLAARSGAAIAFTGYEEIDDAGRVTASKISRAKHLIEAVTLGAGAAPGALRMRAFLAFGNPLPCSSVTFQRLQLGPFAFDPQWRSNLDWLAWIDLLEAGKAFVRTPERLVGRRHNALTATASLTRQGVRRAEDLAMFRRIWPRPFADLIALAYRAGYQ